MSTAAEIRTALVSWAEAQMPYGQERVIIANQNAPRPERPYATILIASQNDVGEPYYSPADNYGVVRMVKDRNVTVSVQVLGPQCIDIASALSDSLEKDSVRDALRTSGVIYAQRLSPVNDISAVHGSEIEPRAQFDAEFRVSVDVDDEVGWIETVIGTATFTGGVLPREVPFEMGV